MNASPPKWEDTVPVEPRWEDTTALDEPSLGESILRAASQGLSLKTSDEAAGVGAGLSAMLNKDSNPEKGPIDRFLEAYRSGRDDERASNLEAKKAHPVASAITEVASMAPAAIATGGESLLGSIAGGAAIGGISAAGESEKDLASLEFLKDLAKGTGFGAAGGAVGYGAGKLIGKMLPKGEASAAGKEFGAEAKAANKPRIERTIEESIEEPIGTARVTDQDKILSAVGDKNTNVVAYGRARGGKAELSKAPSLDANDSGNLRAKFSEAIDRVHSKLGDYETKLGDLIEKSNLRVSNAELASGLTKKIKELEESGVAETAPGKAAIQALKEKLTSFVGTTESGTPYIKAGDRSAKWVREYLQGLREENKSFFDKIKTGQSYTTESEALQDWSKFIDNTLKDRIPGYEDIMAPYHKDLTAYLDVRRSMGRQQVADFFSTKVKKPAQELLVGKRYGDEKWVRTLKDFGDASGEDFLKEAQDRMAYAHLFPSEVSEAEAMTIPQEISDSLHGLEKMASKHGGSLGMAADLVPMGKRIIQKKIFEKEFENAARMGSETSGVGAGNGGRLLRLVEASKKLREPASFIIPRAGIIAGEELGSPEPSNQTSDLESLLEQYRMNVGSSGAEVPQQPLVPLRSTGSPDALHKTEPVSPPISTSPRAFVRDVVPTISREETLKGLGKQSPREWLPSRQAQKESYSSNDLRGNKPEGTGISIENQRLDIPRMGKYAPVLERAKQAGSQRLAVVDYVLSHSDPEYSQLKKDNTLEEETV